jgi:hypothetical protein
MTETQSTFVLVYIKKTKSYETVPLIIKTNTWSGVIIEDLTVAQLLTNSPSFTKPKISLPYSQTSVICLRSEPRNHVHAYLHCSSYMIQNWIFFRFSDGKWNLSWEGLPHFTTWWRNQIRFLKRCFLVYLFKDAIRKWYSVKFFFSCSTLTRFRVMASPYGAS